MTERGDTPDDTQMSPAEAEEAAAGAPEVSHSEGARALAEGAAESDPEPVASVQTPAAALDESATTPDRGGPKEAVAEAAAERPELFVAAAFVGGLALALLLKRVAGD